MTDYNRVDSSNLDAVKSDGTAFPASRLGASTTWGVTLTAGTFYFPFGASKSPVPAETSVVAVHIRGAAALASTITVEDSIFPATTSPGDGRGVADVTDYEDAATAGNWIPENPSTAIVGVIGTGWSAAAATVTTLGTGVGGAMFHISGLGSRRGRLKLVVTVGGLVRVGVHGKSAA